MKSEIKQRSYEMMRRTRTSLAPGPRTPPRTTPKLPRSSRSSPKFAIGTSKTNGNLPTLNKQKADDLAPKTDGEKLASYIIKYTVERRLGNRENLIHSESFTRASPKDIGSLFIKKCQACCCFCDFHSLKRDEKLKILKLNLLHDLQTAITTPTIVKILPNECFPALTQMISTNLFRKFPYIRYFNQPEFILDNEFSHIDVIYNILSEFFTSTLIRPMTVSQAITDTYLIGLFRLFYAYDTREQKRVEEILQTIVNRFPFAKPTITRLILRFIRSNCEETPYAHSISSIISFFNDIFQKVADNLPKFHKFYSEYFLHFYKMPNYPAFHSPMSQLNQQIIIKFPALAQDYIKFMATHFPFRSPPKIPLFFDAIMRVLDNFYTYLNEDTVWSLILKISLLFEAPSMDISQQSLFLMMSDGLQVLMQNCPHRIIHTIYQRAHKVSLTHWLPDTRHFAVDVCSEMMTLDFTLQSNSSIKNEDIEGEKRRNEIWEMITGKQVVSNKPIPMFKSRSQLPLSRSKSNDIE